MQEYDYKVELQKTMNKFLLKFKDSHFLKNDFENHDLPLLKKYKGEFLYAVRESGTNLFQLDSNIWINSDKEDFDKFFNNTQEYFLGNNKYFFKTKNGKIIKIEKDEIIKLMDSFKFEIKKEIEKNIEQYLKAIPFEVTFNLQILKDSINNNYIKEKVVAEKEIKTIMKYVNTSFDKNITKTIFTFLTENQYTTIDSLSQFLRGEFNSKKVMLNKKKDTKIKNTI